ncbi:hypothetical protein MVEN_02306200 [Mycena venus]|uniref:Uncharacterized protein n=1 Tax=Mycena venus TaxID=2733690 RepID=A0A8H6X4J5_9AGAR|nr:hypothetical protein MVEN_02306200 [Mycena venus]
MNTPEINTVNVSDELIQARKLLEAFKKTLGGNGENSPKLKPELAFSHYEYSEINAVNVSDELIQASKLLEAFKKANKGLKKTLGATVSSHPYKLSLEKRIADCNAFIGQYLTANPNLETPQVSGSPNDGPTNGLVRFTTHCFRRGGAQYRFLWADRKWSLKAVKWWGGWSSNENVGTLMRYLLDELMVYEEGFSDIMMDDRVINRHETFMGEDERVPVSKADLLKFEDSILMKIRGMIAGVPAPPIPASTSAANASIRPPGNGIPATRAETPVLSPASPTNDHITPSPYVPQPSRIPETKTLDDALTYWEHGAPQKGLDVPLKEWATLFKSSEYASEAVKLGNIRFGCEEFRVHCNGDFAAFEEKFPGMQRKFTMLMKAVRAERKLRGGGKDSQ